MLKHDVPIQTTAITIERTAVKDQFAELLDRVSRGEARVVVTQDGTTLAALVSVDDLRRLEQLDREWNERTKAIERFSQAFADVPTEEAEEEVARIIAERRRQRAETADRRSA